MNTTTVEFKTFKDLVDENNLLRNEVEMLRKLVKLQHKTINRQDELFKQLSTLIEQSIGLVKQPPPVIIQPIYVPPSVAPYSPPYYDTYPVITCDGTGEKPAALSW